MRKWLCALIGMGVLLVGVQGFGAPATKPAVIDCTYNGKNDNGDLCIGISPTTSTTHQAIGAYMWFRVPGDKDGVFSPDRALLLFPANKSAKTQK